MFYRFLGLIFIALPISAQTVLQFKNTSRLTIYSIEVRGSGEARWSRNILNRPLSIAADIEIDMPASQDCRYEIRGKDENERTLFNSLRIDLCQNGVVYTGSYFLETLRKEERYPNQPDGSFQDFPIEITFTNRSKTENIHAIYLREAGSRNWSSNILNGFTIFLSTGESEIIPFNDLNIETCIVDIKAEGLGRKDLGTIRNVDLCQQNNVELRFLGNSRNSPSNTTNGSTRNRASVQKIRIKNTSRSENIHKLYIRPVNGQTWGENRLDNFTIFLSVNQTTEIRLPELTDTCLFDIRADGLGGKDLGTIRRIDLCRSDLLEISF